MALRNHWLAALVFFSFMAVVHSWPLASNPSGLARLDNHDAELNTWIIAWVAHTLPTNPLGLFEAPIFYPENHSLAFSEHMFVPSLMGAPLLWAGASPVLVYNILIILGFALSGFAMYWLMMQWTGSTWAALTAGLAYAFNAHALTRFVHLQAMHVEFFPIVLYAFDRVLRDNPSTALRASPSTLLRASPPTALRASRTRDAVLLAAAFVLQALCSNHLLVFTTYALVACAIVRWRELRPLKPLLIAAAIAVVLLAPFLWPYYQVDQEHGLARSADVVTQYNAGWRDYLVTGGRLHYAWWSHQFYQGRTALFPGFTVAALALAALYVEFWGQTPRFNISSVEKRGQTPHFNSADVEMRGLTPKFNMRIRMVVAIAVVGVALSFGTALPGYAVLHESLPLLSGLRNVARWGWLALAAAAILAGFGVAMLERSHRFTQSSHRFTQIRHGFIGASAWNIFALAVCALITIEAIRTPVAYTPVTPIPAIYDRLAGQPVVVAEFPFYSGASVSLNGPYVLANTRYFRPLLNGYSSFHPESFMERGRALDTFPSERALAELNRANVTHVLVHVEAFRNRYQEPALQAIDTVASLELVTEEDGIRLYRMKVQ